jgi:myo-inositol 2-dehydrogenase/D-chiro-inositol 1-dehydrogenase
VTEIRAGIVGLGNFFETVHLPCMRRVPGLHIVAAADLKEDRRRRARQLLGDDVELYTDHRGMLAAGNLDAVYVLTLASALPAIVPDVAAARLPLFCEKPPGETSQVARELAGIAAGAGIPHQVAFNRRFGPFTAQMRRWLQGAGTPSRIEVVFHRVWAPSPAAITGAGIHAIDLTLSLFGPARHVMATRAAPRGDGFGAFTAAIEFASGAAGSFVYDNRMPVAAEEYHASIVSADTLTVERLTLKFPPPSKHRQPSSVARTKMIYRDWIDSHAVWDEQNEEYTRLDLTGEDDLLIGGGYQDEHDTFVRSLLAGAPLSPTFADTVHSMEIAETIQAGTCRDFAP